MTADAVVLVACGVCVLLVGAGSMKPLRCRVGRHTGQKQGGTLMYTCPRCDGSFFQRADLRYVGHAADLLIRQGRLEEARDYARREIERRA